MIKPYKNMDLQASTLNISSSIIEALLNSNKIKYNTLKKNICSNCVVERTSDFDLSLSFLYLLGKIEYDVENDIVELII